MAALSAVAQDSLVFPNGDRLSGHLVAEEEAFYHFESDALGRLTVPVEAAELVRGAPEERVDEVEILRPHDADAVAGIPVPQPATPVPAARPPWTGRFDLGYTWQSGRAEKNELALRAQSDRRIEESEYRLTGEFLYGQVDGVRNTHRYIAGFRWRESFTERLFSQSFTRYEADRMRGIRNRAEQDIGIGYRFLRNERAEASVVPGVTIQYTDERGVADQWDYLGSIFQDFVWRFNSRYRIEQDFNALMDPADTEDYIIRFNAGVVGTVRKGINLSIRYQYLFENQTRPGVSQDDQRLITSVGYVF